MAKGTKRKGKVTRLETEREITAKLVRQFKRERLKDLRALSEALRHKN